MIKAIINQPYLQRWQLSVAAASIGRDCKIHFAIDTQARQINLSVTRHLADEITAFQKLPAYYDGNCFCHFWQMKKAKNQPTSRSDFPKASQLLAFEKDHWHVFIHHCSNNFEKFVIIPECRNVNCGAAGIAIVVNRRDVTNTSARKNCRLGSI